MSDKRIVILGAGPAGLGAAYRLSELGHKEWDIYERNPYVGGLCASLKDERGFVWDMGLHVIFSRIAYFNKIINKVFRKDYYEHMRRSFIFKDGKWIPYPFQNNIKYLEHHEMEECIKGLIRLHKTRRRKACNFEEWIHGTFGCGIAKYFMAPYNMKVWRHPLDKMSYDWIGERVSVINIEQVLDNIINNKEDTSWGLHNTFKYPSRGGSGEIFRRVSALLSHEVRLNKEAFRVDASGKAVTFKDGTHTKYDYLINTSTVDTFVKNILATRDRTALAAVSKLAHTKAYILGIGFEGPKKRDTFWAYFPDKRISFYRMTYSGYSPHNVPNKNSNTIQCEVSARYFNKSTREVADRMVEDLTANEIITPGERKKITSRYMIKIDRSYPIPTLGRDRALEAIQDFLISKGIYSRGRFGAWKYEVGNMDHSFMQGVEAVDHILLSKKETTLCPPRHRS